MQGVGRYEEAGQEPHAPAEGARADPVGEERCEQDELRRQHRHPVERPRPIEADPGREEQRQERTMDQHRHGVRAVAQRPERRVDHLRAEPVPLDQRARDDSVLPRVVERIGYARTQRCEVQRPERGRERECREEPAVRADPGREHGAALSHARARPVKDARPRTTPDGERRPTANDARPRTTPDRGPPAIVRVLLKEGARGRAPRMGRARNRG